MSGRPCKWVVVTVGMAAGRSAVLVVAVVVVLTRDIHVLTDGTMGIIATGGTETLISILLLCTVLKTRYQDSLKDFKILFCCKH